MKIQTRTAKKTYLNSKRVYSYEQDQVTITKKYHSISKPFRKQELDETVWVQDGSLIIKLTPKKTPSTHSL